MPADRRLPADHHPRDGAAAARAALLSSLVFAWAGAFLVLLGSLSILAGSPARAHDLAPLGSPADVLTRPAEVAPLITAEIAAVVAIVVAFAAALRRLDAVAVAVELLVLGIVIEACVLAASDRVGHTTDGGVMGAAVVCVMGGAAIFGSGIVAPLARLPRTGPARGRSLASDHGDPGPPS